MHRFGWFLIVFGALLLLSKAGFFLLPLLLLLLFLNLGRRFAHGMHPCGGPHGWQSHSRHGHHGYGYHRCRPSHGPAEPAPHEAPSDEPRPYTGETTRL